MVKEAELLVSGAIIRPSYLNNVGVIDIILFSISNAMV